MDLGRGARKYTPADAGFSQTGANTEVAAVAAVTIDVIFYAICELISPRDAMRLCLTCRDLSGALRARRAHVYSAFPARLIAKHGLRDALEARWSRFGHTQPEVDEALVGACAGAQDALARWLLTRPEAKPRPAAVDAAFVQLAAAGRVEYGFFAWFVGESPLRPSQKAAAGAFTSACGHGNLGFALLAFRAVAPALCPRARQDLVLQARAAASEVTCHRHVVDWATGYLRMLEELYR